MSATPISDAAALLGPIPPVAPSLQLNAYEKSYITEAHIDMLIQQHELQIETLQLQQKTNEVAEVVEDFSVQVAKLRNDRHLPNGFVLDLDNMAFVARPTELAAGSVA
jgi:hypothetical protein